MLSTTASDGIDVRAYEQGSGPPILIVGPGTDDGTRTEKLGSLLAKRFHVLRLHRRQYRLDLKSAPANASAFSIQQEVEDVLALARAVGEPVMLYGHSSGGVVALEALVRSEHSFAGAVLFEPPVPTPRADLGGDALQRARAALGRGRVGKAYSIFTREVAGAPRPVSMLAGLYVAAAPKYRSLVPAQLDDLEAIVRLGVRFDEYARIDRPCVLLGGERSPAHLLERLDALEGVLRNGERVTMPRQDHGADVKAPAEVARVIERLADRVLPA